MSLKDVTHPKTGQLGYRISVSLGRIDGRCRYHYQTVYGITAYQAEKIEEDMERHAMNCRMATSASEVYRAFLKCVRKKSVKLKDGFKKYLTKPGAPTSEKKIETKRSYWLDFVKWMKRYNPLIQKMSDVTPAMAEDYTAYIRRNGRFVPIRGKKLSNYTLNAVIITCKSVFKALRHETGIDNPFDGIKGLSADKRSERKAYTFEQLQIIMEKADEFMKPLFFIGLFTGLAEGDVCTLRKDEIFFDRRHIYHRRNKTGAMSSIPMLPVLQNYLEELCNDPKNTSEYVLPEHFALYSSKRYQISRDIKHFLEYTCDFETSISIPGRSKKVSILDFHSLRHTFCTLAGIVGIPLTVVQSIVGHMTPAMTKLYSQHIDEQSRLHWIDLFGERIASLPVGITEITTQKHQLLEEINTLSESQLSQILNMIKEQK